MLQLVAAVKEDKRCISSLSNPALRRESNCEAGEHARVTAEESIHFLSSFQHVLVATVQRFCLVENAKIQIFQQTTVDRVVYQHGPTWRKKVLFK